MIYIDMVLRIVPTPGTRIDFQKVRDFIYALRGYGFGINLVTLDGWQSEDSMQQLIKQGFESEILSMDRLPKDKEGHPYSYLRQAILENRISYYQHPMFLAEAINLQRILLVTTSAQNPRNRWKIDHPPLMLNLQGHKVKGSKDVADAVGGVVRHCMVLDPAAQESALPSRGLQPHGKRSQGAPPPPPAFISDEEWLATMSDKVRYKIHSLNSIDRDALLQKVQEGKIAHTEEDSEGESDFEFFAGDSKEFDGLLSLGNLIREGPEKPEEQS
jgi:hypothetical protein